MTWPSPPAQPSLDGVDLVALDSLVLDDGGPLPPSYRRFVRAYGWARLFGLWLVYPPVLAGCADGLSGRGGHLTATVRARYADAAEQDYDWTVEPDGDWDLAQRLQVFGWSENGDYLAWDTGSRLPDGEMPVWTSSGGNSLRRLGNDLGAAMTVLRADAAPFLERPGAVDIEPLTFARL